MARRKLLSTAGLLSMAGLLVVNASVTRADNVNWNPGIDGNTNWSDGANWGGTAPANNTSDDIAVFDSTSYNFQPVLQANTSRSIHGLQFGDGTTAAVALTIGATSTATPGQVTVGTAPDGSTTVTLVDATGIVVGEQVSGTNRLAPGTIVTAINGNTITLSAPNAVHINDGTQLTFTSSLQIGSGGVIVNAGVAGVQNIVAPVILAADQTWTNHSTKSNALTIEGGIYLGSHTLTLTGDAGSTIDLPESGALSGEGALVVDTDGTVTFGKGSGGRPNNPFTGGVTLNAGTINLSGGNSGGGGGAGALGTGVLTINGGQIQGNGNIAGHPLTISGQVWNADWTYLNHKTLDMGTGAISLGTAAGTTRTVTVNNGGTYLAIGGVISNGTTADSLTKAGEGTLHLYGASTYTGVTTISQGTLALDATGSIAGSSRIDIADGATFDVGAVTDGFTLANGQTISGTGTIVGAVTVADGGILAPGNSPGTLHTGSLVLNNASVLDFQLGSLAGPNDLIDVTGDLTLNGILNVTDLGGLEVGQYTLLTYTGVLADSGLTLGALPGAFDYSIDISTPNRVLLNVSVPEPASGALALLGLGGLLLTVKRRRYA